MAARLFDDAPCAQYRTGSADARLKSSRPNLDFTETIVSDEYSPLFESDYYLLPALLAVFSETYAASPDRFHAEAIIETVSNNALKQAWRKIYRSAIKGPGNLYRIETRSPFGSYIQNSDGKKERVYLIETKTYVVRPVPQQWPQCPKVLAAGNNEPSDA